MLMNMIQDLAESVECEVPAEGMQHAVDAVVETCDVQLGWRFEETDRPDAPQPGNTCRGSSLALSSDAGTWLLIALCNRDSAQHLTRALFAMDEDEDPLLEDLADALNEIVNVAAGVFKSRRDDVGERVCIGLPTYLDAGESVCELKKHVTRKSRVISNGKGVDIRVFAFWQEGAGHGSLCP